MSKGDIPPVPSSYSYDAASDVVRVVPRKGLLERLPPTAGRVAAFEQVHERLAIATEFFLHHGDGGRYGVYRAMADLMEYFTSRGVPHPTLAPVAAVMAAIVDADRGTPSAIFEPQRSSKGGAPPKSVIQLEFEGKLAIILECCVRHLRAEGKRPYVEPALRMAAKLINESPWSVQVTATQLREIRERVQQSSKESPDRAMLDIALSGSLAQAMPLEWAKRLLAHEWVNPPPASFRVTAPVRRND